MMDRSTTEFSLWQEDMIYSQQTAEPHLRLRISKIISHNSPHINQTQSTGISSPKPSTLTSVLARCSRMGISTEEQEIMVLFSSNSVKDSSKTPRKRMSDLSTIHVGREIHVWQPWSEVEVSWPEGSQPVSNSVILCARFMAR